MVEKKLSRSKRGARRHGRYPTQALVLKGDEMSRGGRAAMAAFPLKRDEIRTRLGRCALPATSNPESLWKEGKFLSHRGRFFYDRGPNQRQALIDRVFNDCQFIDCLVNHEGQSQIHVELHDWTAEFIECLLNHEGQNNESC